MMYQLLNKDFEFQDERGKLTQLVHGGWEQINVLETWGGVIRGKHCHKETEEAFYIITGNMEVTFTRDDKTIVKTFMTGDFFLVEPYVFHSMKFNEFTLMVAMYRRGVERPNGTKDIYSE